LSLPVLEAGCGLALDKQERSALAALGGSDATSNAAQAHALLHFFCGRGQGLTPAGDDLIWGFSLAQLWCGLATPWLTQWRSFDFSARTTHTACAYHQSLRSGYLSQDWQQLLTAAAAATVSGNFTSVKTGLRAVQACGHTSGHDALLGWYRGLESVERL
jgi:hypothetical protein